jgi:protein O-mannosyl-transferase
MTKHYWHLFLIVCVVAAVFSPALRHPFVQWDDDVHCYNNPHVRALNAENIKAIFTSDVNKTYIPLTIFSFALEYRFFKDDPFIYHLDNILLHLMVVLLMYSLARRLGVSHRAAACGAFLFGVHPMHVESVAWVTQRKDVLYSAFYLVSCWYYVGFLKTAKRVDYCWMMLFALLSILSKPMALSFPLVLLLLDWFVRGRITMASLFNKIPVAFVIFPIAWITYLMNMRPIDLNFPEAPLVWLWSLSFYLTQFLFPAELLALYQLPEPVTFSNPAFQAAILTVMIFILLLVRLRRQRLFIFAGLFFLVSIFFLLRFDNKQDLSFVADRFMYLPSLGLCLFFGSLIDRAFDKWGKRLFLRGVILTVTGAMYVALSVLTFQQTRLWGDEFSLWSKVTAHFPSAAAHNHLGNYFLARQDYAQALFHFDHSIAYNPRYHKPYGNRGITHMREGNYDAAIADFTIAITLRPEEAGRAYNNRGYAYARAGEFEAALDDYDKAIALAPNEVAAYLNRATIFKDRGDLSRALQDMQAASRVAPEDEAVKSNIQWLKRRMDHELP